jgi:hypothetical protein
VYLLIAKILGPIALLAGLWFWHTSAVSTADTTGYERGLGEWRAADKIAVEVGAAQSALLARDSVRNREKLIEVQTQNAKRAAVGAASLADRGRTIDELRSALAAAPAKTSDNPTCPAAASDEASLRSCRAALSAGLAVAGRADRLVEAGERILGDIAAQVTALQGHADLMSSAERRP